MQICPEKNRNETDLRAKAARLLAGDRVLVKSPST